MSSESNNEAEAAGAPSGVMRPVVALVGRPNVGKSTLFNRLVGKRRAIVEDTPGVTRDRLYVDAELLGRKVRWCDTGGLEPKKSERDKITDEVQKQTELGINEADVVVFVVDGQVGRTPEDESVARKLRRAGKNVIVAVNKIDGAKHDDLVNEFYRIGLSNVMAISAAHGRGMDELREEIVAKLPEAPAVLTAPVLSDEEVFCKVAVLGRPNVGKSSLVNRLLGSERHIASDVPGTTRDAIDSDVVLGDKTYRFIDTAGLRRKARIEGAIETQMVASSLASMDRADVVVLVLDATEMATDQEAKLASLCADRGKGLVVAVNKWDVRSPQLNPQNFKQELVDRYPFMSFARVLYLSAKTGQGIEVLYEGIDATLGELRRRLATPDLNRFFENVLGSHPPPMLNGKRGRVYFVSQVETSPPTLVAMVNDPERISDDYRRYLVKQLREEFGFEGAPVRLILRRRHGRDSEAPGKAKLNKRTSSQKARRVASKTTTKKKKR